MNVLFIVQRTFLTEHVGVRRVILYYIDALKKAGFAVHLAALKDGQLKSVVLTETASGKDLSWIDRRVRLADYAHVVVTNPWLCAEGLPDIPGCIGIVYDMVPNLIATGCLKFSNLAGVYSFAHAHDIGYRYYFRNARRICSISDHTRLDLIELYKHRGNTPEITTCIPFAVGNGPLADSTGQRVLLVNVLDARKNLAGISDVLDRANSVVPIKLDIVGRPRSSKRLIDDFFARLSRSKIEHRWHQDIPDAALKSLYGGSSVLLFPSLYEGLGLPVLEAQEQGVPAITTNLSSLPEININSDLCFGADDVEGMATAVAGILTGTQRPVRGNQLRQRLADRLSAQADVPQLLLGVQGRSLGVPGDSVDLTAVVPEAAGPTGLAQESAETFPCALGGQEGGLTQAEAGRKEEAQQTELSPVVIAANWSRGGVFKSESLDLLMALAGSASVELHDTASVSRATGFPEVPSHFQVERPEGIRSLDPTTMAAAADKTVICLGGAVSWVRYPLADYSIGRTMFETDRLPSAWVAACNKMDEVWVPSQFNLETFSRSGVAREKLAVIPCSVDSTRFDPAVQTPFPLTKPARCNFLSCLEWSNRSAWREVISAYLQEFSGSDEVCLWLYPAPIAKSEEDPMVMIERRIRELGAGLGLSGKVLPRVELIREPVPAEGLPGLYLACDCYISASRGDASGRSLAEAMFMERPVIATHWAAAPEMVTEQTGYLVDPELVEARALEPEIWIYKSHQWASPSEAHLRKQMRHVALHPEEARAKGRAARSVVMSRYSRDAVAKLILDRLVHGQRSVHQPQLVPALLANLHRTPPAGVSGTISAAIEGSFLDFGSLSNVNRDFFGALAQQEGVRCVAVASQLPKQGELPKELAAFSKRLSTRIPSGTDVVVRHEWPPRWTPPTEGAWVQMQPWEYGSLPADWVKGAELADQVWCYTRYVANVYLNAGIPAAKLRVLPLGINPEIHHPGAQPFPVATTKSFRFLFVGGTIHRKGADILLQTYLRTFRRSDDVCLVIKDFGGASVYSGQTLTDTIRVAQADPSAPEIVHIERELSSTEMAGLYTACQCFVHPYRGEGFGLPVLEAMASALPVIVTGGGSTDDFATDEFVHRIPAQRVFLGSEISGMKLDHRGWLLEPSPEALSSAMQEAVVAREPWHERALRGSDYVRTHWTWERTAVTAAALLLEVRDLHRQALSARESLKSSVSAGFVAPDVMRIGQLDTTVSRLKAGELLGAWNAAINSISERPFHPEAWLLLGEIAVKAGDFNLARRCVRKSSDLAPDWKPAKKLASTIPNRANAPTVTLPEPPFGDGAEPRLTVCLIVKNEERFIGRCLDSIRGLANQIVVVDTGSTDRTVAIAQEHGAEIHHYAWDNHFSNARNEALRHARGDWILALDADEELPTDQHPALQKHLRERGVIAWRLPLVDFGRESEGVSQVPRLFRNAPGVFYVSRIHEQVYASLEVRREQWGLQNRFGSARLIHYGYQPEVVKSRDKIARNLKLLELANDEIPNDVNLLMNLGLELWRAGQQQFGIAYYEKAYRVMGCRPYEDTPPELREVLLTQYASHLLHLKRFGDLIEVFAGSAVRPADVTASQQFLLALAYQEMGSWSDCVTATKKCLELRSRPALTPIHAEVKRAAPEHCLANSLKQLGKMEEAEAAYRRALLDDPSSEAVRLDLAIFESERGGVVPALTLLTEVVGLNPGNARAWEIGGIIALRRPDSIEFAVDWTGEAVLNLPQLAILRSQRAEALLLAGRGADSEPLWAEMAETGTPSVLASFVLSRLLADMATPAIPATVELAVSHEFVRRYRQLVEFRAEASVVKINSQINALEACLPSAAGFLRRVVEMVLQPA